MSAIDGKLQEYQLEVGYWTDRQRGYESQARECALKADLLRSRIAGIKEALQILESTEAEAPSTEASASGAARLTVRKRQRSLTGHWQQIMQLVDGHEGFDYDTLAEAVEAVGHDANRDTLRSQMSLYKQSGIVEAIEDGRFRLTDAGRRVAGIAQSDTGEVPPNENGAAEAAPEARPDANPA
ncbi:hypothetical protein F1C10_02895 [Sphingomonas sp. NBWT7]|uniref:hypothetical protein n=1 Tax=Sphingomonas sp. NBWT7 TaxID=2596913 RepID=UPI00162739CD|nr:hypothetical protein [Sphingomonas sp. NBWT7]QNE31007.1 hypothetical protein F1C10_02895 [Sphingomonas sp. NBWT7]